MKRIVILMLCCALLICIASCGQKEDTSIASPETTSAPVSTAPPATTMPPQEEITEVTEPETTAPTPEVLREIVSLNPFYEDRAWISYSEDGTNYYGIIDKQGNILTRIKFHQNMIFTSFSNGFTNTYNYETKTAMIIDKDGNLTYQYSEIQEIGEPKIVFNSAGILVTYVEVSDFYAVGHQYTIYGHDGNVLEQFITEQELQQITDCGKGVIRFPRKGFLCLETYTWVSDEVTIKSYCDNPNFADSESNAGVIGVENSDTPQLVVLHTDGSVSKHPVNLPYDSLAGVTFHPICGDYLFIHDPNDYYSNHDNYVISVNLKTGDVYRIDASYREHLDPRNSTPISNNGRIIVPIRGADDAFYNFIFDEHMNQVCGPVDYFSFRKFSDSVIIGGSSSNGQIVYDKDGEIIYSLGELGYSNLMHSINDRLFYSCGVLLAYEYTNDYKPTYLDKEGNPLFDTYNFANAKHIETTY